MRHASSTETRKPSKLRRNILATAVAATVAIAGYLAVGQAEAQIGNNELAHIEMKVDSEPSSALTITYSTFLAQLRSAVSVTSSDGGQETQTDGSGVVAVRLTTANDAGQDVSIELYIAPQNLYVLGYGIVGTTNSTWRLSDAEIPSGVSLPATPSSLPFGGNYNALVQAAGRGRESMSISFNDIRSAILALGNAGQQSDSTAKALMLMIQMTSEAARFADVETNFRQAFGDFTSSSTLSEGQMNLENNWGSLSQYWDDLGAGSGSVTVPNISGVGTIENRDAVRRYIRVLLGSATGKNSFDPGRDEL
jgi:hypothetical protein